MRLRISVAVATVFLALAACTPRPVDTGMEGAVQTPTAATCAARGGTMQAVGRAQTMQCVIRYADAGKPCSTGADCAGDCRIEASPFPDVGAAAAGQCQADSRPFGCYATVENGKATHAICVD